MNPRHLDDDHALDLLHGLVDAKTEPESLRHLAACPQCEARFRELAGTHERGRARAARLIAAGVEPGGLQLVPGDPEAPHRRQRILAPGVRLTIGVGLAAAAVLVMLLLPRLHPGARLLGPPAEPGRPLAADEPRWLPDPRMDITLRAEGAGLGDSLRAGLAAYARRDLPAAARLLARPMPEGTADDVRRIYLADVELRLSHPRESLAALHDVMLSAVPQPWRDQGHWTLVRALERLDRRAAADSVLRVLALEPGETGREALERLGQRGAMQ